MMEMKPTRLETAVFSTCPQSNDHAPQDYLCRLIEAAKWSEDAGCTGTLVYTDNGLTDPWLSAQIILENTERLCPLVAIQPIYMHPYTVAKMISSFAFLYGRRIYLNMVAGGFRNDLLALNDQTAHDQRYNRLVEYTNIIVQLLSRSPEAQPLTVDGEFYRVKNLKLTPPVPAELMPGIFISGSSDAGMSAVKAVKGATAIQYPKRVDDYDKSVFRQELDYGIRVGLIARDDPAEAWRVAEERFPEDRKGQLTHQMAMKVSDSQWHRQLSKLGEKTAEGDPYWLRPFENYKTMCPYLVGDYNCVATVIAQYIDLGYAKFILDIPPHREELEHTDRVFSLAKQKVEAMSVTTTG